MSYVRSLLLVFGFTIVAQSTLYAEVSPMGLTLSKLKTAVANDKDVSSPLEKGYSSDYRFWENSHTEIQVWLSKNKVVKAQWVYGGDNLNSSSGSKREFNRFKNEFTEKFGKPILDTRAKDGYIVGWEKNNIGTVLSLELPTSKYGLPILKVIQIEKGSGI